MRRHRTWTLLALLYTALIYATLPIAPRLWRALRPHLQPSVTFWFVAVGGALLLALAIKSWHLGMRHRSRRLVLLVAAAGGYQVLLFTLFNHPTNAERLHLLLYGGLAWLAANAVRAHDELTKRRWHWPAAALLVAAAGALDEGIQELLPMRYFGWSDILGNWIGAALGSGVWLAAARLSPWARKDASGA